jgi:hypothetical protein
VVLSKKSSGGGFDGAESAEALSKQVVEALAAGDGDGVVAMSVPFDKTTEFVQCPAEEMEKAKKTTADASALMLRAAAAYKGHALVFKGTEPMTGEGVTQSYKEGDQLGPCKALKPFGSTALKVNLEYEFNGQKVPHSTIFSYVRLGDRYYLGGFGEPPGELAGGQAVAGGDTPVTPPATDAGPAAVPVSGEMAAAVAEFEKLRNEACACKDKVCAETMMPRLAAAGDKYGALLTDANMVTLGAAKEAAECLGNAMSAGGTAPPDKPSSGNSIPECDEYAAAAAAFIKCDKVPPESRKAIQDAVDQLKKTWGDGSSLSGEMRKSAADTCIQLRDAMKQGAQAMGCP